MFVYRNYWIYCNVQRRSKRYPIPRDTRDSKHLKRSRVYILQEILDMRNLSVLCVPRLLNTDCVRQLYTVFDEIEVQSEKVSASVARVDETWINCHYINEIKEQSKQCASSGEPSSKKIKTILSCDLHQLPGEVPMITGFYYGELLYFSNLQKIYFSDGFKESEQHWVKYSVTKRKLCREINAFVLKILCSFRLSTFRTALVFWQHSVLSRVLFPILLIIKLTKKNPKTVQADTTILFVYDSQLIWTSHVFISSSSLISWVLFTLYSNMVHILDVLP